MLVMCWDRCGDVLVGMFEEREIGVLRSYADGLLALLGHRARSYTPVALGEGRSALVPDSAASDPRLLAMLVELLGPDEPDWVFGWHEVACFGAAVDAARAVLATLPPGGGRVVLWGAADVRAWRLVISLCVAAIRAVTDDEGRACGKDAGTTVGWLETVASGLVTVSCVEVGR